MSNDLPAIPPAPDEEPQQRVPESVLGSVKAQAPADAAEQPGLASEREVGARLAWLRGQRGMSLEDVSARLKVAVVKLKALEGGDLSRLKDVTFTLGVVRSYAKILGADPEPMVRVLRHVYGANELDLSMPASRGASLPRGKVSMNWRGAQPRRSGGWKWGVGVVVAAICLVVVIRDGREPAGWFAAHLKAKVQGGATSADAASAGAAASSTVAVDAPWPASGVEGGPPTDNSNAAPVTDAAQAAPAALAPASLPAAVSAPAQIVVAASAAQPMVSPSTVGASAATTASAAPSSAAVDHSADLAATTVASPAAGASAPIGATVAEQPGVQATLTFKVTEDSWISVRQQNGREIFSGLVHPGDAQQVAGTRPLKVTVGNVHGIEAMDIDGAAADLKQYLSSTGNVARFTLP